MWLIAGTPERSWLFNTADGKRATALPSDAERIALSKGMMTELSDCPRPFVDVLALKPFQAGHDDEVRLSPEKARNLLQATLVRNPRFRELQFVHHGCYGGEVRHTQRALPCPTEQRAFRGAALSLPSHGAKEN